MNTLWKERVLVQLHGNVLGPFPVCDLRRLSGFTSQTMISFPGSEKWAPAFRILGQKIFFDSPLDISPREESQSPQMDTFPGIFFARKTPAHSRIADFVAPDPRPGLADRWFRRLVIFNFVLVLAAFAVWSYLPLRMPLQNVLQPEISQMQRRLMPVIERLQRGSALPSRTHALHMALQDLTKVESDLLAAFKAR